MNFTRNGAAKPTTERKYGDEQRHNNGKFP